MKFYTRANYLIDLFVTVFKWTPSDLKNAEVVIFPGGEDINPELYNEKAISNVYYNQILDNIDVNTYNEAKNKFKIGICRGAQFLNVMNGGKLWQDVNNHTRDHMVMDDSGDVFKVTSTHHQQMRPAPNGIILLSAKECDYKTNEIGTFVEATDIECVWYPETKSFCYQPHPEFNFNSECCDWFYRQIMSLIK